MLSRPTTEQILLDCRNELLATIDPAVTDPQVKIAIQMMENVLRNCAARAGHEVAWMCAEIDAMVGYAETVAASDVPSDAVSEALGRFSTERATSLHLDDVCATYDLAGDCFSAAIDAALDAGDSELVAAGRKLLDQRLATELEIMGEWAFVGRG
jgi:hypothetical protein